jgi:hypothetical protein
MNIMQIFEILQKLESNNSRNFKIDFLKENSENKLLKEVVRLALDPFTQFYIRKIPPYKQIDNTDITLEYAIQELGFLSNRIYTGNSGIEHLQKILCNLPEEKAKVIECIIQKDLKCGVSTSTANKVWPNLVVEYPCMLCSPFEQKLVDKIQYPAYVQLKLDGMRFNAIVRNGTVELKSRNGKNILVNDENFLKPFLHMAGFYGCDMVFDGELLVFDDNGSVLDRQTGNGILNKAVKGTQSALEGSMVRAILWDCIPLEGFQAGVYKEEYKDRVTKLQNCISDLTFTSEFGHLVDIAPTHKVLSYESVSEIFNKYLSDGQEGIILKSENSIWENKRSKGQIKFKGELECDLKVVAVVKGTGKYIGMLGAIVCESSDGIIKVNVGSGFSDEQREKITAENIVGKIVAIKYNARIKSKTGSESLFLPVFIETRSDKTDADNSEMIK